jgi:heptosyltransferase-1
MSTPRVLLVKTSSLGDVIHTFPALTDARTALPGLRLDWVVEEAFAELPGWHGAVEHVIPVAIRRWRAHPWRAWRSGEWAAFRQELARTRYDLVIDAQGLLKSALIARLVDAPCAGLDAASAREPLAARACHHAIAVPRALHAIERTRRLFAAALGYPLPAHPAGYGITPPHSETGVAASDPGAEAGQARERRAHGALPQQGRDHGGRAEAGSLLFLHGSSRAAKCWPEAHWCALAAFAAEAGLRVLLPWGNEDERVRALRVAAGAANVSVLPRLTLADLAACMQQVCAVVAVDTGLGHLAAALGVPCVSLYGPTDVALIGTVGSRQQHLVAADGKLASLAPRSVWQALAPWLPA